MIFNTYYWQRELERLALVLRRHMTQRRWVAASDASVEKSIMIGLYAVRKMLDSFTPAFKIPQHLKLITFPRLPTRLSPIVFPSVEEAFDLTKAKAVSISTRQVCDEVIHSHFFSLWVDPSKRLRGVFFASDRHKDERICRLDVETISVLFETIARSRTPASLSHFVPDDNRVVM
jgi:hypothetical protein